MLLPSVADRLSAASTQSSSVSPPSCASSILSFPFARLRDFDNTLFSQHASKNLCRNHKLLIPQVQAERFERWKLMLNKERQVLVRTTNTLWLTIFLARLRNERDCRNICPRQQPQPRKKHQRRIGL